jgi:hypothetical protein
VTGNALPRNYLMTSYQTVTVFGAYGHTGRFVVAELCKRGWTPILSGRDHAKLNDIRDAHPGLEVRVALRKWAGRAEGFGEISRTLPKSGQSRIPTCYCKPKEAVRILKMIE